ncbi:MAG: DUF2281 domain-containing protein [Acinetobacter sp.]|nr:DUF2281 domain-containing protein [Acinetobacter sp.]
MIEIAIQDIQKYDLTTIHEEITLNINGNIYLLNPTIGGKQYILTLLSEEMPKLSKKPRKAGSAKGQIWMSDDFDEPLECMAEYMPTDDMLDENKFVKK